MARLGRAAPVHVLLQLYAALQLLLGVGVSGLAQVGTPLGRLFHASTPGQAERHGLDESVAVGDVRERGEQHKRKKKVPSVKKAHQVPPPSGVSNAAAKPDVENMGGTQQEFQCGSSNSEQIAGCDKCTMSTHCESCDGIVKFGYGSKWSQWWNVSDLSGDGTSFDCNTATFGEDPYPEHGKICLCRPKDYICAIGQKPTSKCVGDLCSLSTVCHCVGEVRYGYGDRWTESVLAQGSTKCGSDKLWFADSEPNPEQDAVCQCFPTDLAGAPLVDTSGDALGGIDGVVRAIIAVIMCYFIVYTWLAIVRTSGQLSNPQLGPSPFERVLEAAATSCVYFAPMLCAIFLAVSKRADTLSDGAPFTYHMPATWLQWAIGICATAFCIQTASYILAEWAAVQGVAVVNEDRPMPGMSRPAIMQTPNQVRTVRFWRSFCNLWTAIMYVALVCILVGIVIMKEPGSLYDTIGRVALRDGTVCTIILAIAYVVVYLSLHIYRNQEHAALARGPLFGLEVLKLAAIAVNFAPMLCILFLGTQIAIDWEGVVIAPSLARWMYICVGSVLLQVVLVVLAPFVANAELQVVGPRGEVDFVTRSHDVFILISILRWAAMTAMYVGIVIIAESLWFANVVPAMTHGLYRFAVIYFAAYLALWVAITARQLLEGGFVRAIRVLGIAKDTVVFCPMLAALFLESFVRAHHIINSDGQRGQPQSYVQDAMVIAAVALVVQLISVCCAGVFSPSKSAIQDGEKPGLSPFFLFCFHCAMLVLYVCVVIVIVGIFTLNKNNATSRGAWFA